VQERGGSQAAEADVVIGADGIYSMVRAAPHRTGPRDVPRSGLARTRWGTYIRILAAWRRRGSSDMMARAGPS
jgi:2-polyprenyl-6-methoxyphenol hydroxylase-like FAD-dependent oxidoreductase